MDVPEPPVGTLIGQEMVRRPVPREVRVPAAAPLISVVLSAPVVASGGTRRGDPAAAVFGELSGAALPPSRSLVPVQPRGYRKALMMPSNGKRWAWASNDERTAALPGFLHRYKYHRPHTALKGLPPVHRTSTVTNLHGCNT